MVASATGAEPPWTSMGPAPIGGVEYTGRVSAIACSPTDANRYFVGGADGGVWRTTDGGLTWTPLTDAMPTTAIGALAIDPSNEQVLYAGTGEANFAYHSRFGHGLYKSTDGGSTWVHLAESAFAGRCFSKIVIAPDAPDVLFAGVTAAGGFNPPGSAAKGHPLAGGPVGVFKSEDGGANWTQPAGLPALAATDLATRPDQPQTLFAAIGHPFGHVDNGIYRSTDGGTAWTRLAGGLPTTNVGRISIAIAPSMPQRIFASITQAADSQGGAASLRGLYRSDDGGNTWVLLSPGNYMATYGWYLNVVSVQPTNPSMVLVGGVTLLRSTNAGSSWTTVTPPHVDQHALAWDAAGRLLAGDDGGVHRSTNVGTSWTPLNAGLGLVQFYAGLSISPASENVLVGGTQDNGSNLRNAGGAWTMVLGGDGGVTAVDQANSNIVFCQTQGTAALYRSTTGGGSLTLSVSGITASDRNSFHCPYEIAPSNSQRVYYGTHRVYRSVNGGINWTPISPDLTATPTGAIHSLAVAPSNAGTVWVTTNDGNVQVTFNDGGAWQLVRQALPGWFRVMRQVTVAPDDEHTAYLAGSRYGVDQVLRTTDGGANWMALDGDLPDVPVNVVAVDARSVVDVIYAGTEAGVYRTLDGGGTWRRYGEGLPNTPVIDLRVDAPRNRLVVATQGRGAWRIDMRRTGDVNGDGLVDSADLDTFVDVLLDPDAGGLVSFWSDTSGDGLADGLDIGPLVRELLGV